MGYHVIKRPYIYYFYFFFQSLGSDLLQTVLVYIPKVLKHLSLLP
jgi:hypothetical protein